MTRGRVSIGWVSGGDKTGRVTRLKRELTLRKLGAIAISHWHPTLDEPVIGGLQPNSIECSSSNRVQPLRIQWVPCCVGLAHKAWHGSEHACNIFFTNFPVNPLLS